MKFVGRSARRRVSERPDFDAVRGVLDIAFAHARRYGRSVSVVRFRTERRDVERTFTTLSNEARAGEIVWTERASVCVAALEGTTDSAAGTALRLTARLHDVGISVVHQYAVFPEHGLTVDGVIAALDESIATRRGFVMTEGPEPFDLAQEA